MRKRPQNSCTRLSGDFKDAPLSCGACSMSLMERQGRTGRNVEREPSQRDHPSASARRLPTPLLHPCIGRRQTDGIFPPCSRMAHSLRVSDDPAQRPGHPGPLPFPARRLRVPRRFLQCIEPGGRHEWIRHTRAVIPPAYRAGPSTTPTIPTASRSYAGILLRSASSAAFASSI